MVGKEFSCWCLCSMIIILLSMSSQSLMTWSQCPDKLLSSVPQWIYSLVHRHWQIMKQFMFFSSLTCSVTFSSRAHPASSMIKVIKKVEMTWELISFDYAEELSKKHLWRPSAPMDAALHRDAVISVTADWRGALNCYVILSSDWCGVMCSLSNAVCECVFFCACPHTFISAVPPFSLLPAQIMLASTTMTHCQ